jgi:hypothetical protein
MATDGNRRALFVAALARGATVLDASEAAGISERTAHRWFRQPDVAGAVEEARKATLGHARERLLGLVDAAADTLRQVMAESSADAARVAAARTVLAQALRFDERDELERRLAELEQVVQRQQTAHGIRRAW